MLTPLFARVVIERESIKAKTTLIIPETAEKRNAPGYGKVIAVGPTADESVKNLLGKRVLFGRHAGEWFKDGERDVYVVQDEDIIAEAT